jgi:ubiquinone/menaquinone biosynthesis C-methylase UbiE
LGLAPSQWEPLIPTLAEQYCTITLGGAHLGVIPAMELRGEAAGYRRVIKNLMSEAQLQPGQSILDVGSGSGVVDRWLAHATNGENQITGLELNPYFLREATQLTKKEGLAETISFQEGDATSLPFPDDTFDLSFSSTVMEEVDADKMLAEMVRVTKPGGKVGAVVRAIDLPFIINLALRPKLMEKLVNMHMSMSEKGCADASLYRRFHRSSLTQVKSFPQLATFDQGNSTMLTWLQNVFFFSELNPEEQAEWREARAQAETEATFFISWPHHCAVGTKAY